MTIPNFDLVDVIDGGSAENGQEIFFTLRLNGGANTQDINIFWPYEKFGALVAALSKFAAMTGDERRKLNPSEGAPRTLDVAFAPPVEKIDIGPSQDGQTTILRAHLQNRTHYDLALGRHQLEELGKCVVEALQRAQNGDPRASTKKKLN